VESNVPGLYLDQGKEQICPVDPNEDVQSQEEDPKAKYLLAVVEMKMKVYYRGTARIKAILLTAEDAQDSKVLGEIGDQVKRHAVPDPILQKLEVDINVKSNKNKTIVDP